MGGELARVTRYNTAAIGARARQFTRRESARTGKAAGPRTGGDALRATQGESCVLAEVVCKSGLGKGWVREGEP